MNEHHLFLTLSAYTSNRMFGLFFKSQELGTINRIRVAFPTFFFYFNDFAPSESVKVATYRDIPQRASQDPQIGGALFVEHGHLAPKVLETLLQVGAPVLFQFVVHLACPSAGGGGGPPGQLGRSDSLKPIADNTAHISNNYESEYILGTGIDRIMLSLS